MKPSAWKQPHSILLALTCLLFVPILEPRLIPPRLNPAFDAGCHHEARDKTSLTVNTALGSPFPGNRYEQGISMATSFDFLLAVEVMLDFAKDSVEQQRDWDLLKGKKKHKHILQFSLHPASPCWLLLKYIILVESLLHSQIVIFNHLCYIRVHFGAFPSVVF